MLDRVQIFPLRRLVLARFSGLYTTADGMALIEAFLEDPEARLDFNHLYDLSGVDNFDADYSAISRMVSWKAPRLKDASKDARCVLLAPGDIAFGMARMYQSLSADVFPFAVEVTRDMAEALAQVNQPETTLEALIAAGDRA